MASENNIRRRSSPNGKTMHPEKAEFMRQMAGQVGITFSLPDYNGPSESDDLQFRILEAMIQLDSHPNSTSRTPRKKKPRKHLQSMLDTKESRRVEALQHHTNPQDLANSISCLSLEELLSAVAKLINKRDPEIVRDYLTKERQWLMKCLDEGTETEEDLLNYKSRDLQRVIYVLLAPVPMSILTSFSKPISQQQQQWGYNQSAADVEVHKINHRIAQVKNQILSNAYDDVCRRVRSLKQANEGAAKYLRIIEQNDVEDNLEMNEEDLKNVEELLLLKIKEVLIILWKKKHQLTQRSVNTAFNLIRKLKVDEDDVDKLDASILSIFVNQLHILTIRSIGRSGRSLLTFNDFSN